MSRRHCCGSFESKWWTLPGSSSWDSTRGPGPAARRRLTTLLPRRAAGPVSRTSVSVSSRRGPGPRLTYRTSAPAWPMFGTKASGSFASCARIAAAPGGALGPAAAPVGLGRPASGVLPERAMARSNSVQAVTPRPKACIPASASRTRTARLRPFSPGIATCRRGDGTDDSNKSRGQLDRPIRPATRHLQPAQ